MNLSEIKKEYDSGKINKWEFIDKMYSHHITLFDYAEFIKSTNISSIEITDDHVIMQFRESGVKLKCLKNDKRLAPFDALNFNSYENDELNMQLALMSDKDTVLDIGGNIGWYAIHVASKLKNAFVYSFEPIPNTFKTLQENISINNLKNITALNFGFSDSDGSFDFYYDPSLSVNASLANVAGTEKIQSVNCKVKTIDEWIPEAEIKFDFIKCDVEGAELLVFKGGEKTIADQQPVVFTEMLRKWTSKFNYHPNDIINFFFGLGYNCFTCKNNQLKMFNEVNESTIETNYFFLHKMKHANLINQFLKFK
jgi:FkbM family methyltransferase